MDFTEIRKDPLHNALFSQFEDEFVSVQLS